MAGAKYKTDVDFYKVRLVEKHKESKILLTQTIPEDPEAMLFEITKTSRTLESRLNSFTESFRRFQCAADSKKAVEETFDTD